MNTTYATRLDLAEDIRSAAMDLLQASLVDAVDLFTQVKQAHWNVGGISFAALHELFDRVAETVEEHGDLLAERITALGGRPDGTARTAAQTSRLADYPAASSAREHLEAVADRLAAFGATARAAIDRSTELGDAGTADLFTEISREIDRQLWFTEAHLRD